MAKQATKTATKNVATEEVINEINYTETTSAKNAQVQEPTEPTWEIKDRIYYLKNNKSPLTLTIPSKHTKKHALCILTLKQANKERLGMLLIKTHHL
jgi:hypothetical protein